jgi:hypothetical protein
MHTNNDPLGVRSASVAGSDAEGRPLEVRQSARPTFFIWSHCDSGHSFSEVSRGTKEFHVDKITARDRSDEPPNTQGVASSKLAGTATHEYEAGGKKMYDMYRHLKLTPYRAMISKDAPFPSERHAQNWRKVGTIETVSPEAKKHIDQKGFCVYIFTPTLSFDEIEGSLS